MHPVLLILLAAVVIAAVLFWLNPVLALLTIGVVVPVMVGLTLWFRKASDRGYTMVRDRNADVMADLQAGLAGLRTVTAHNRRRPHPVDELPSRHGHGATLGDAGH